MFEFFFEYGLFLAKSLTLVTAVIITIAAIFSITHKAKSDDGTLVITHLNEHMNEIRMNLQGELLPKPALKKWLKEEKQQEKSKQKTPLLHEAVGRLFVLRFDGDIRASDTDGLRECISAILQVARKPDEVLVILESPGGFVQHYGLAASQLQRIRAHDLTLTVAIDKCAASGGYLMACVANKILAAPFAVVGSIGVVAQVPNFHRLLKKHDIDYELLTAGEYKRTLTVFGENTPAGREKFQEELEETHNLFKQFITIHRPIVDINKVASGEHWHAAIAKKMNLVDDLMTSDDYILDKMKSMEAYELAFEEKKKLADRFFSSMSASVERLLLKLSSWTMMR